MKTAGKTNRIVVLASAVLLVLAMTSEAYSWGAATHVYVSERLNTHGNIARVNEMYGGNGPDVFNYMFQYPYYRGFLQDRGHDDFMAVWDGAVSKQAEALAFGFVAHNDLWGADFTAHHDGRTFGQRGTIPEAPEEGGYVIAKARILKGILEQVPEFNALGLPEAIKLEIFHVITEHGVDLLVKRADPAVGKKLLESAMFRNPDFPRLLVRAYGEDLSRYGAMSPAEAAQVITSAEAEFRRSLILYGQALMQDEATAIRLVADNLADISAAYLAAYGLSLPPGADIAPLVAFGLGQSMALCAGDIAAELDATAEYVDSNLAWHGIYY